MPSLAILGLVLLLLSLALVGLLGYSIWYRAQRGRAMGELLAQLEGLGGEMLIDPEPASYRGAKRHYGRRKREGLLAMTDGMVIFQPYVGESLLTPLVTVHGVELEEWFGLDHHVGRLHLVLVLNDANEIAYFVEDCDRWRDALLPLLSTGDAPSPSEEGTDVEPS